MGLVNLMWRIPIKIVKSGAFLFNHETKDATPRRRPLHTCGASCLAIAHKACIKAQDYDGPLGSMAKRAITFTNYFFPFIYAMLYQWLALLSVMDDHILNIESMVEMVFPQSTRLFDKIDGLVHSAEVLPEHLDHVLRKIPLMIHQFPFLDWILAHLISCLNCLISILTHRGSTDTREKEITIDVSCNENHNWKSEPEEKSAYSPVNSLSNDQSQDKKNATKKHVDSKIHVTSQVPQKQVKKLHSLKNRIRTLNEEQHCGTDSPMYSSYQSANSSPVYDSTLDETYPSTCQIGKLETMSCTYKEVLEKGTKEDDDKILPTDVQESAHILKSALPVE